MISNIINKNILVTITFIFSSLSIAEFKKPLKIEYYGGSSISLPEINVQKVERKSNDNIIVLKNSDTSSQVSILERNQTSAGYRVSRELLARYSSSISSMRMIPDSIIKSGEDHDLKYLRQTPEQLGYKAVDLSDPFRKSKHESCGKSLKSNLPIIDQKIKSLGLGNTQLLSAGYFLHDIQYEISDSLKYKSALKTPKSHLVCEAVVSINIDGHIFNLSLLSDDKSESFDLYPLNLALIKDAITQQKQKVALQAQLTKEKQIQAELSVENKRALLAGESASARERDELKKTDALKAKEAQKYFSNLINGVN